MENWLTKQAELAPYRTALVYEGRTWSFKQLKAKVHKIAGKLTHFIGKSVKRAAIIADNTPASYFMILAFQQLGVQPVLLNCRLAFSELERQREDAEVLVVFVDDLLKKRFEQRVKSDTHYYFVSELDSIPPDNPAIIQSFEDDKIASIMYTSGTTGHPHGVLQTFRNHFFSAVGSVFNLGLQMDDQWLCAVPIFHISGLSIMMRSLIYGTGVILVPHFDPVKITKLLSSKHVSLMSVVPIMLKRLLELYPNEGYNDSFRTFLLGGAPIDAATLGSCQKKGISVIQSYGMTETCSQIVALGFADAPTKIGSVGKPLFPVQLRIDSGNIGEIEVKAPNLAEGYLNDQVSFNDKMTQDGWFKTGDIGSFDKEGFLFIKGRKDEMFISGGENVFPNEVEDVYAKVARIKEIAVIGISDKRWGQVPCAFIELQAHSKLDAASLKLYGRERLAHYKVPQAFIAVDKLPHTANGKLKHSAVRKQFSKIIAKLENDD